MSSDFLAKLLKPYEEVSILYDMLSDKESKALLIDLIAYRILGHKKIKLSRNTAKHWDDIKSMSQFSNSNDLIKIDFMDAQLALHDFSPLGFDIKMYCSDEGAACIFKQKQYEYFDKLKVEKDDIVIDGGGCWGDTSLHFAHEAGENGKVYSFEFIPSNINLFQTNLKKNPELEKTCEIVPNPLWDTSGNKLYYVDWGPGSRVSSDEKRYEYDGTTTTVSIDDFVKEKKLKKIDFIKLDVEGAEVPTLRGAKKSILKYHPKMALSLYHQLSDFIDIPKFLQDLGLNYKYYLGHHTIYENETVLYCVPVK